VSGWAPGSTSPALDPWGRGRAVADQHRVGGGRASAARKQAVSCPAQGQVSEILIFRCIGRGHAGGGVCVEQPIAHGFGSALASGPCRRAGVASRAVGGDGRADTPGSVDVDRGRGQAAESGLFATADACSRSKRRRNDCHQRSTFAVVARANGYNATNLLFASYKSAVQSRSIRCFGLYDSAR